MRFISLFSGHGGGDLGFERAGLRCVFQAENDRHARLVLQKHWPGVILARDVRQVSGAALPDAEIVLFGSPCQNLSVAGRGEGISGEKSHLFFEACRIISEKREASGGRFPLIAVWENVPGAKSLHGGADFAAVLAALAGCGAVDAGWRVLNSRHWSPQRRRRVWTVAVFPPAASGRAGGECAREILAFSRCLPRPAAAGGEAEEGAVPAVAGSLGGGGGQMGWACDTDRMTFLPIRIPEAAVPGGDGDNAAVSHLPPGWRWEVRRLTPLECLRLQSMPDGWHDGLGLADSHRYRLCGNAMNAAVAQWMGEQVARFLERSGS